MLGHLVDDKQRSRAEGIKENRLRNPSRARFCLARETVEIKDNAPDM